jgi:hypothetical protein
MTLWPPVFRWDRLGDRLPCFEDWRAQAREQPSEYLLLPAKCALRMNASYLPCEIDATIPSSGLLPGNFVSVLFSASPFLMMRHSLALSIQRDRRKGA